MIKHLCLFFIVMTVSGCAFLPRSPYERASWEDSEVFAERMRGQYLAEQAKLTNLYQQCVQKYSGNLQDIKSHCEPIIAPIRVDANLSQGTVNNNA